jgi:ATP adenylyltransferase
MARNVTRRAPRGKSSPAGGDRSSIVSGAEGHRLWAPWRYEYLKTAGRKENPCIFCFGTLKGAERKRRLVIHQGDDAVIMLNRYPYNNGHLMIAPRRHVASPELLTRDERAILTELISKSVVRLRKALKPSGLNVGANLGRSAGAGFAEHMHWHIVPRWDGDTNFVPVLTSTRVISQHLDSSYRMLAPLFKSIEAQII